jgi:hypothetical protein
MKTLSPRGAALVLAITGCALAAPATAQTATYRSSLGNGTIDGVVVRFAQGSYDLGLRDDGGYYDNVRLHDGTIIFPIGLTLRPGMRVRIVGFNEGAAFTANEIDGPRPPSGPVLQQPRWYAQWNASTGYRNAPAPAFVNPPASP